MLSFESPDQSTEGVDEADGSKKGKDKEGVKVSWKECGEEREDQREREFKTKKWQLQNKTFLETLNPRV